MGRLCPGCGADTNNENCAFDCSVQVAKQDERLLNAFQLVKNGIKIGHLKFHEFKRLMEFKHGSDGKILDNKK